VTGTAEGELWSGLVDSPDAGAISESRIGSCVPCVVVADMGDAVSALDARSTAGRGGSRGGADGGDVGICVFSSPVKGGNLVLVRLEPTR
jgi:hypothetical protein